MEHTASSLILILANTNSPQVILGLWHDEAQAALAGDRLLVGSVVRLAAPCFHP
jgi:hypothetical protein